MRGLAVKREFLVEQALGVGEYTPLGSGRAILELDLGCGDELCRGNLVVEIGGGSRVGGAGGR